MEIWKRLIMETRHNTIDECITNDNHAKSKREKSNFWNQGIIGHMSSEGEFDLVLHRGRYKEFHYVGKIKEKDNKIVYEGVIKPKKKNMIIFIFLGVYMVINVVIEGFKMLIDKTLMLHLYEGIIGLFILILVIGFIYLILRLNISIVARKIEMILLE